MVTKTVFPPALLPGETICVISPAGPVNPDKLYTGVKKLEAWGYKVVLAPYTLTNSGYLSGSDSERLNDLIVAFQNDEVSGVFCSRGGYGVLRLLKSFPWQEIAKQSSKAFVGFSDISAFQLVLWDRCKWVTFSGPQVAMGMSGGVTDRSLQHLSGMLDGSGRTLEWSQDSPIILNTVRSGREVQGTLLPCNLSMLVSLVGTEFMPDLSGSILCIEDLAEASYRIDRMFWQLESAGVLRDIKALVLGAFTWNDKSIIDEVCKLSLDLFDGYSFSIWYDLPYGHIEERLTLPVGMIAQISENGILKLC